MNNDALEKQKRSAQLASAFAADHPNDEIKTVDDLYRYIKNTPGDVEGWIGSRSDIPIDKKTIQELASSFQAADQLEQMLKYSSEPQMPHGPSSPLGMAAVMTVASVPMSLAASAAEVKMAGHALTSASPDVDLYQFVPTEIEIDKDFKDGISQIEKEKVAALKQKSPTKKFTNDQIDNFLLNERENTRKDALDRYNVSSDRSEKIKNARENDIYIKDSKGRVIGERVFVNKKNKPDSSLDPVYRSYQRQKYAAINRALDKHAENKKNGIKQQLNETQLSQIIEFQYDGHFAALFPEKAAAYATTDSELKHSLKTLKKAENKLRGSENGKNAKENEPREATSAKGYQKKWNDHTLEKAKEKGYNRFNLLQKLRDLKVWKNRPWKDKANPDRQSPETDSDSQSQGGGRRSSHSSIPRQVTKGLSGENTSIQEWTSPRGLGTKAWNRFATPRISNINRRLGRSIGQQAGKSVGRTAAKSAAKSVGNQIAKKIATQAVTKGATTLLANPVTLTIIGVVLGVILLIILIIVIVLTVSGGGDSEFKGGTPPPGTQPPINNNPIPDLTLQKSVSSDSLDAPAEIEYTITYSLSASGTIKPTDITIFDTVPENTIFIRDKTTGAYTLSADGTTISWSLADPANTQLTSFSFTVLPTATDISISNSAWATSNVSSPPGGAPPNSQTCNGYYSLSNPVGNFGDPSCDFEANKEQAMSEVYSILQSQDPENADYWYAYVIPCESFPAWNANSHSSQAEIGSPDAAGVWGLFSMGRGLNGDFDHGDVDYKTQTSNAMSYAALLRRNNVPISGYWACWDK